MFGYSDGPLKTLEADRLGLSPYADSLADFIRRCETPITIAIQGDWGTGKTSLMFMVKEALEKGKRGNTVRSVWFNTWQYSQFSAHESLPASLLASLLRQIAGTDETLVQSGMRLVRRLMRPAANAVVRYGTSGSIELGEIFPDSGDRLSDPASDADALKTEIQKAVNAQRERGTDRIVIFIDDLDRILPERAVEILEIIKLFLDWEGCVFVLALDYAVVKRGLTKKFSISEQDLGGRSFFDKIIQLPFTIPVAKYDLFNYIEDLFGQFPAAFNRSDFALFSQLLRHSVSVNPRGIKRVLNSLQLLILVARAQGYITIADKRADRLTIRNLFAVLCLQMGFQEIYDWLVEIGPDVEISHLTSFNERSTNTADATYIDAVGKLTEERQADFYVFAQSFFLCIQDPDGKDGEVDDVELRRFKNTLLLTKITAIGDHQIHKSAHEIEFDNAFRAKNREFVNDLIAASRGRNIPGAPEVYDLRLYQPRGKPIAEIILRMSLRGAPFQLRISHEPTAIYVYTWATQHVTRLLDTELRTNGFDTDPTYEARQEELIIRHVVIDRNDQFDSRREAIKEPLKTFFQVAAHFDPVSEPTS